MTRTPAVFASVAVVLAAIGSAWPAFAYTGDDPVIVAGPSGIAACQFSEIRARIGPDNTVTYKIYGTCQGAAISGELTFQAGQFYESFVISNREKIDTSGYCDSDPWATAINCHDQAISAAGMNVEPHLEGRAPLSLLPYGSAKLFHDAFNNATRPNPPGMPVNFSATADFGQMTARWVAPDNSGDRPYLGFLVQVQPHGATGGAWTDFGRINWHSRPEYILPGKLPPLSSTVKAWDARVCAVTQLAQTCTPALLPGTNLFHEVTEVKNDHSAAAAILQPAPTVAFARVKTTSAPGDSTKTICDYAKSARARNSPAAPGLERQCAAQGGTPQPIALGRIEQTGGVSSTSAGKSFCEMAAAARAAGRPTAAALQQRCDAERAAHPAPAAPAPAGAPPAPVRAPHDLVVGRISYTQDGQQVAQPIVGRPVAVACNYFVNEVAGPFNFAIQPWQGLLLIGGQVPQSMVFQGDTRGGQHEARQAWTPAIAGRTPVSCVLNQGFESAEAQGGNNRWNETIDVVTGDEAMPAAGGDVPPPPADDAAPPAQ